MSHEDTKAEKNAWNPNERQVSGRSRYRAKRNSTYILARLQCDPSAADVVLRCDMLEGSEGADKIVMVGENEAESKRHNGLGGKFTSPAQPCPHLSSPLSLCNNRLIDEHRLSLIEDR